MSKQSEAKAKQGYTKDVPKCSNCVNFSFDTEKVGWGNYVLEKNLRCGIGMFKVNKTAACNMHTRNPCDT